MKKFILKLMILSDKFPDGFSMMLPDGSVLQIKWLIGHEIHELPNGGIKLRQAFGIELSGSDFGEVIITVYVTD